MLKLNKFALHMITYDIFHEVHDDVKMMQTEKLGLLFSVHAAGHHAKA